MNIKEFFATFRPAYDPVAVSEKIRSGLAAFTGILLLGFSIRLLPGENGYHLILFASMAAAAVLLYAAPHSPMAQPWPLVGGNLVSGLIGWICSLYISDPILAAACAVGSAVLVMHLMHCLHPPGGATSLIMVLGAEQFHQHGWLWAGSTVLANTLFSLLLALSINNLLPGRHYPQQRRVAMPPIPELIGGPVDVRLADIEWALKQMDGMVDVSEEDLLDIYRMAVKHSIGEK